MTKAICIGGPWDESVVDVGAPYIRVPIAPPMPILDDLTAEPVQTEYEVKDYRLEQVFAGGRVHDIYRLADETPSLFKVVGYLVKAGLVDPHDL